MPGLGHIGRRAASCRAFWACVLAAALTALQPAGAAPVSAHSSPASVNSCQDPSTDIAGAEDTLRSGDAPGAAKTLQGLITQLRKTDDTASLSAALGVLGLAQQDLGDTHGATASFEESERLASQSKLPHIAVRSQLNAVLLDVEAYQRKLEAVRGRSSARAGVLGTRGSPYLLALRGEDRDAVKTGAEPLIARLDAIAKNAQSANEDLLALKALVTAASIAIDIADWNRAQTFLNQSRDLLSSGDTDTDHIGLRIAVGNDFLRLSQTAPQSYRTAAEQQALSLLGSAEREAGQLGDAYLRSYAIGLTAKLDALHSNDEAALRRTRSALALLIQDHSTDQASELELRWRGQLAAILQLMGRNDEALSAYEGTLALVERVRPLVAQIDPITGRSFFRQTVEPVLLAYTEMLLDKGQTTAKVNLFQARERIETLKALEVEQYFEETCRSLIGGKQIELDDVDAKSVIIYPILFDDGIRILASSGSSRITLVQPAETVTPGMVQAAAYDLRYALQTYTDKYAEPAHKLYDWLIRPLLPFLQEANANTLVIIPDGALRSIPFAVLMDENNKYLIEKGYSVATMVGLSLSEAGPRQTNFHPLYVGLSQQVKPFVPLPGVPAEIGALETQFARGPELIDKSFTKQSLERLLSDSRFNVIHFATHGVFGGRRDNSFILTGDGLTDPDAGKLTIPELEDMVEKGRIAGSSIDVLGLSACQTAIGNDQVVLGLAGVAFKAGAKSVFASLWNINDAATAKLVPLFYSGLKDPRMSKAQALRAAQLAFLKEGGANAKPSYWGAFILLGNWQ